MIEVSSEQSRSQFYIHKCCWRCRCCSVCYYCFFSFCYVDTVCGFTAEYLDLVHYNYVVRCCTTYEYVFVYSCLLLCRVLDCCCCLLLLVAACCCLLLLAAACCCLLLLAAACCCLLLLAAACCCCSSSCAGWQICSRGSLHLIPVFFFSSFKHDLFSMYPLAVL